MKIEDLIKSRKEGLDLDIPPDELWQGIKKEWKKEKKSFQWWKVAAIIFMTISLGLLTQNVILKQKVDKLASLGDISPEYKKVELDYLTQVSKLEATLPISEIKNKDEFEWIFQKLQTLEDINLLYRKDIGIAKKDQLVGVLIDYYEKKIRLLRKLELEIKRSNKFKSNEKNNFNSISI